jgi:hypothetical protein
MLHNFTAETSLINCALDGRARFAWQNREIDRLYAGTKSNLISNALDAGEFQSNTTL